MHWRRMAERFEAELRRPPDSTHPNVYRPSATERAEREQRLAAQAAACRCAARFYAEHMHVDDLVPEDVELIDDVLGEQLPNAVCSSGVA